MQLQSAAPVVSKQLLRLQIQGAQNIDQAIVDEVGSWLRLGVATCATLAAIGTIFASPLFFFALIPIAFAAAIFETHPVDHIYNHIIRRFTRTHPLPKRGLPTRIACGVGGMVLLAAAFAFLSGQMLLGYVLGSQVVMVAGLAATTDICIPSIIYQLTVGRRELVKELFVRN